MDQVTADGALPRREVVGQLLRDRADLLVVAGLGSSAYDVMAAGDNERNFYLWGAMGAAAMVGMGLAMARPSVPVLVVTGDGEALMGLGSLATIAVKAPRNLTVVVLDNGHFGETGMQLSHAGRGVDLHRVAEACGWRHCSVISGFADVDALRTQMKKVDGPRFATIKISAEEVQRCLPPRDGVFVKNRFRGALGLETI